MAEGQVIILNFSELLCSSFFFKRSNVAWWKMGWENFHTSLESVVSLATNILALKNDLDMSEVYVSDVSLYASVLQWRCQTCHTYVEKLKIFMYGEVYIKLLKEQKTGNCKNICIYFDRGLQQFKNLKKENKKFQA